MIPKHLWQTRKSNICELTRYKVNPAYQGMTIIHYWTWKRKAGAIKQESTPPIKIKTLKSPAYLTVLFFYLHAQLILLECPQIINFDNIQYINLPALVILLN